MQQKTLNAPILFGALLAPALFACPLVGHADEANQRTCDLSKTNRSCVLVIDRQTPVAPPPVQMYSGEHVTVRVTHPLSYERYFLDYSTGAATLAPDVTSSIAQGLFPSLATLSFGHLYDLEIGEIRRLAPASDPCAMEVVAGTKKPARKDLQSAIMPFRACLFDFAAGARKVYRQLEPYAAPDSVTPQSNAQLDLDADRVSVLEASLDPLIQKELSVSANITTLTGDDSYKAKPAEPGKPDAKPPVKPTPAISVDPSDAEAISELTNLQKAADAIAADLIGYRQRLAELEIHKASAVSLTSRADNQHIYQNMVSRSVTYSLDALNILSSSQDAVPDPSKKRALASIVIVFADSPQSGLNSLLSAYRWEASAGVFISTLSNPSFSAQPTYEGTSITNYTVHEVNPRPTVVPFAAANYRITDDLGWSRFKSNFYWTLAIGVNPNTKTADFAVGPSIAWRAFMISALVHWGHENRLNEGFTNGESLGATFVGAIPTDTHWTTAFALGFSVRVPALVGR